MDIRPIVATKLNEITELLVHAFDDDPWFNFVATQDRDRLARMRRWLDRGLRQKTFPYGETYATTDREGVALWTPPDIAAARFDTLELWWSLLRACGPCRLPEVQRAIARIIEVEPTQRHMELRLLAVEPAHQGHGIASALMRPMLERCDAEALPIALLSTKAQNIGLYNHFGFAVTAEVAIPRGPTVWQMWRPPAGPI